MQRFDVLATTAAGAVGAAVATFLVGESLLLVVPAAIGVGLISLVADRRRRPSR